MAYQTGVSATIADLVTAIVNFSVANGWTAGPSWSYVSSGTWYVVTLSRSGSEFVTITYSTSALFLNTASATVSGASPTSQTGAAPNNCEIYPITPPHVGYHLFTDGLAVHCVVEVVAGAFTHLSFGLMTKNGTWAGGTFVTGSWAYKSNSGSSYLSLFSGYSRMPFFGYGSAGSSWGSSSSYPTSHFRSSIGGTGRVAQLSDLVAGMDYGFASAWIADGARPLLAAPNASNGRAAILPINFFQGSSGASGPYYQLGCVPNAGVCNIANLDPKAVVNTDWMVFPIGQKNGPAAVYINSGNYAMAYKK